MWGSRQPPVALGSQVILRPLNPTMSRSPAFRFLARCAATAAWCERSGQPEAEAVAQRREQAALRERVHNAAQAAQAAQAAEAAVAAQQREQADRRRLLQGAAGGAALLALGAATPRARAAAAADVAIVGAGVAGLHAASALAGKAQRPQVCVARTRVGGRVWSLRGRCAG